FFPSEGGTPAGYANEAYPAAMSRVRRLPHHQSGPPVVADEHVVLVESAVLEPHDPRVRAALGGALVENLGFGPERVAVEHGVGEPHFLVAKVAERSPHGQLRDVEGPGKRQREEAVEDAPAVDGGLREFFIKVEWLEVHGQ